MSKDKNPRRVADNEARAKLHMLKPSPPKLKLDEAMIRDKKIRKTHTKRTSPKKRTTQK